jgi:hypothetical protein
VHLWDAKNRNRFLAIIFSIFVLALVPELVLAQVLDPQKMKSLHMQTVQGPKEAR